MKRSPMKAPTDVPSWDFIAAMLQRCNFVLGSIKFDGIRCLIDPDGRPLSARFKLIPNRLVQSALTYVEHAGLDGELVLNDTREFHDVQSGIMTHGGVPDFSFMVFDRIREDDLGARLYKRIEPGNLLGMPSEFIRFVEHRPLFTIEDVIAFYHEQLEAGYEGIILRDPWSTYKFDRATEREGTMFKIKPNKDDEAEIIDFEPQMTNCNVAIINEQGLSKRSTHAAGMVPVETLGVLICEWRGMRLRIGGGRLTKRLRKEIWDNRPRFLRAKCTFTYLDYGQKDSPRNIRFKGIRYDN